MQYWTTLEISHGALPAETVDLAAASIFTRLRNSPRIVHALLRKQEYTLLTLRKHEIQMIPENDTSCRMWEHSLDMKKEAEGCCIDGAT